MITPNDTQEYKDLVANDIKTILTELGTDLPWLVADVVLSIQDRMGKNTPFVQKALGDALVNLTEEELLQSSLECAPDADVRIRNLATGITGAQLSSDRVHAALAKPAFSLDVEVSADCAPCDDTEGMTLATGMLGGSAQKQFQKIKLAQSIRENIEKLTEHKNAMSAKAAEFKDEIAGVDLVLEVIDARCQR